MSDGKPKSETARKNLRARERAKHKRKMETNPEYRAKQRAAANEKLKQRMKNDPEFRARRNAWKQAQKKRKLAAMTPEERKSFYRKRHLWRRFRITVEEYDRLLEAQDGVCAVCRETCTVKDCLCVDHHHETGQVRGLLCVGCNAGIGSLKEDAARFLNAVAYLTEPPGVSILPLAPTQEVLSL